MRAADTNILLRLMVRNDAKQTALAEDYISKGVWVSNLVLAETAWVLGAVYAQGRKDIADAFDMLLNHPTVAVESGEVVADALRQFKQVARVEFSDCLILAIARKAGHSPLGTFDKAFAKLDGVELIS